MVWMVCVGSLTDAKVIRVSLPLDVVAPCSQASSGHDAAA